MTYGEMNARWINAEFATCAIAGRTASCARLIAIWKGHIVNVYDRLLTLPCGRSNATHRAP